MGVTIGNFGINISAGTTSGIISSAAFNNANGVSFGLNSNTITASFAQTRVSYEPYPIVNSNSGVLSANTNTSGAATFIPFEVPDYLAAGVLLVAQSMNFTTVGTSSGRQSLTLSYGLYSRGTGTNSTTLSRIMGGSYGISVTGNNSSYTINQPTSTDTAGYTTNTTASAGSNITANYVSGKLVQLPISSVLTPGRYWLGLFARASTSSVNVGVIYSFIGANLGATMANLAPIGSVTSAFSTGTNGTIFQGGNWLPNFGSFTSAGQTDLPGTVALSAFSMGAALSVLPHFRFVNLTA